MEVTLTPRRLLDRAEELYGERVGVVCGGERITYRAFAARVNRLSHALEGLGVPPGGVVAFLTLNCHRLLEAYFGVVQAGRILLPLNVRLAPEELAFILEEAEPAVLFVGPELISLAQAVLARSAHRPPAIFCGDGPGPRELGWPAYETLLAEASPDRCDVDVSDDDVAELFYTSGSTARPKGVMLTHRNLYLHALTVMTALPVDDGCVWLHTLPLFHVNGWGSPHSVTAAGGRHVILPRFDAARVLELVEREGVTHMNLVPAMAIALLNEPSRAERRCHTLRRVCIGGAPSSPGLIRQMEEAFRCEVTAGYGLSETSPVLTVSGLKGDMADRLTADERYAVLARAGLPVVGVHLRVVDEAMRDVPRDGRTPGEVVVRGDVVMKGYWKRPAETAEAFAGGWFHTGDVATWDHEGYLDIVDRKKDIIISGGENISSVEVENAIYGHPAVLECAVVSRPDERWGEVPHAFVVVKAGAQLTAEELQEHLRARIAHFKVPKHVEFVTELPKTGTGKVHKALLRERLWAGHSRRVG
jgi:fatty-acyl-CoA synthase